MLSHAGKPGEHSNWADLERELLSFTLPELRGLVLHARVYDPSLWDTTDEEAED